MTSTLKAKAVQHLQKAVALDESGRKKEAVDSYHAGIKCLMQVLKITQNEQEKARLRTEIEKYISRAEELKGIAASKFKANVPKQFRQLIEGEIMDTGKKMSFDDIAGLDDVKDALQEMVIYPAMRPDIFTGILSPARGLLLFGPPGNGKTMIAKALANTTNCTFFNISAASLTSKYFGEGEKMVRALFQIAKERQPSIIFIDEIDSLMSRRSDSEHEASKKIKTEFMVQFNDLIDDDCKDQVIVIAATNTPEMLDDAVIRRLSRRIFVGPPDSKARRHLISSLLKGRHSMTAGQLRQAVAITEGYSGSDLKQVCKEAAMGPVRDIGPRNIAKVQTTDLGKITMRHFEEAVEATAPSVTPARLKEYRKWLEDHEGKKPAKSGRKSRTFVSADQPKAKIPARTNSAGGRSRKVVQKAECGVS